MYAREMRGWAICCHCQSPLWLTHCLIIAYLHRSIDVGGRDAKGHVSCKRRARKERDQMPILPPSLPLPCPLFPIPWTTPGHGGVPDHRGLGCCGIRVCHHQGKSSQPDKQAEQTDRQDMRPRASLDPPACLPCLPVCVVYQDLLVTFSIIIGFANVVMRSPVSEAIPLSLGQPASHPMRPTSREAVEVRAPSLLPLTPRAHGDKSHLPPWPRC